MSQPIPFIEIAADGPPLHFAHANAYPPRCYTPLLQALAERFYVLAVEHRPLWAEQGPEQPAPWEMIADDLIRFFEQEELRAVIGVGHSLGAGATLKAAVRRPELFRALILIEPIFLPQPILDLAAAHPDGELDFPLVHTTLARRRRWPSRQAAFDHFRVKDVFSRWSDDALWLYVHHGLEETAAGPVTLRFTPEWEARFYSRPPLDVWELLPQLSIPTLGMRGAHSDAFFLEAWTRWQKLQPQATFVEVADAGHLLPLERPQLVAQEALAFLAEVGCG